MMAGEPSLKSITSRPDVVSACIEQHLVADLNCLRKLEKFPLLDCRQVISVTVPLSNIHGSPDNMRGYDHGHTMYQAGGIWDFSRPEMALRGTARTRRP
jgi:hypothetical protein